MKIGNKAYDINSIKKICFTKDNGKFDTAEIHYYNGSGRFVDLTFGKSADKLNKDLSKLSNVLVKSDTGDVYYNILTIKNINRHTTINFLDDSKEKIDKITAQKLIDTQLEYEDDEEKVMNN